MPARTCLATSIALSLLALPAAADGTNQAKPPIQDNSFLIEEAYNQEKGIVQHVSTFGRGRSGDWAYTFTQEWPLHGQRHQLSFTLSLVGLEVGGARSEGLGDLALNYRCQLVGGGDARIAVAPRISLFAPTGSRRGAGGTALQVNLPISWVLSDRLVGHWNVGTTHAPHARSFEGESAHTSAWNAGQGLVYQASPRFNVMLEIAYLRIQKVAAPGHASWSSELLLNPGVRWAHDFASGLQVVPGVSVPIGIGPSRGDVGVFLYLSLEHPFHR